MALRGLAIFPGIQLFCLFQNPDSPPAHFPIQLPNVNLEILTLDLMLSFETCPFSNPSWGLQSPTHAPIQGGHRHTEVSLLLQPWLPLPPSNAAGCSHTRSQRLALNLIPALPSTWNPLSLPGCPHGSYSIGSLLRCQPTRQTCFVPFPKVVLPSLSLCPSTDALVERLVFLH